MSTALCPRHSFLATQMCCVLERTKNWERKLAKTPVSGCPLAVFGWANPWFFMLISTAIFSAVQKNSWFLVLDKESAYPFFTRRKKLDNQLHYIFNQWLWASFCPSLCLYFLTCKMGIVHHCLGFPSGTSGKEPTCQCRKHKRHGFYPWVRKIPWRRAWQPSPVFLPGESHGQRNLVSYSP